MKAEIKTAIIFGVSIGIVVTIISMMLSTLDVIDTSMSDNSDSILDKSKFKKAPELVGIEHYLNASPKELTESIKDKVILYDIWTYSCINCVRTLPYITAWDEKYSEQGLLIIGIHSPEFEFEKDPNNVQKAIDKYGIKYPVVLDNEMKTWKAFENRYWPRKYIADHEGYIRYDHIGEGAYQETEKVIQNLLNERATNLGIKITSVESLVNIKEFEHSYNRTPELYFGTKFAQGRNQIGSIEGFKENQITSYSIPEKIELHKFYPIGQWSNLEDSMKLVSKTGSIKLQFNAKEVNIVTANHAKLEIFVDGKPLLPEYAGIDIESENKISVTEPGLYNIFNSPIASTHVLEIIVDGEGFQIFTFTFG